MDVNVKFKVRSTDISISIPSAGSLIGSSSVAIWSAWNSIQLQVSNVLLFFIVALLLAIIVVFSWDYHSSSKDNTRKLWISPAKKGLAIFLVVAAIAGWVYADHQAPSFAITNSEIHLTIKDDGTGVIIRKQTLDVKRGTDKIRETDFSGCMPLKPGDFVWKIEPVVMDSVANRKCDIRPDDYNGEVGMFTAYIKPALVAGRRYIRTLTLTVPGSFTNPDSDWLAIHNNYPVDTISVIITLESRTFEAGTVNWSMISDAGRPIEKITRAIDLPTTNQIKWGLGSTKRADEFMIEWAYGPNNPIDSTP